MQALTCTPSERPGKERKKNERKRERYGGRDGGKEGEEIVFKEACFLQNTNYFDTITRTCELNSPVSPSSFIVLAFLMCT